jgi:hypothetical protein
VSRARSSGGLARASKNGPRGRSHGRSARSAQGAPLPPDGTGIADYPVGCCVLVEVGGRVGWHMIVFRIGGEGAPHCAEMRVDPRSAAWNSGLGGAREIRASTRVAGSCWPLRSGSEVERGSEEDPLAASPDPGSIMQGHLSSARSPQE